ncbi:hypothetical protein [Teredinibacter turnerae]|uniref:hypothetical protein n=1 Tax=Teredinibacter turnerae TaxID=2426 RepID=UPI001E549C57|nr:hypothetical protein [Teredinibacter turnerae]
MLSSGYLTMEDLLPMKNWMLPFLIILPACGGNELRDEAGSSTFLMQNNSNYVMRAECDLYSYYHCDDSVTEPGDVLEVGTYGDIGVFPGPGPAAVFESLTVLFDPGDGSFVEAYEVESSDWSVENQSTHHITYTISIDDEILLGVN